MSVTARFYVRQVNRHPAIINGEGNGWAAPAPRVEVFMSPATRGEENKKWASATPSGEIRMMIGNPEAAAWFDSMLGKDVAITFEERPEEE